MFINVFTEEDKDKLISNGYNLLFTRQIKNGYIYTFENNKTLKFDLNEIKYMKTSMMNF